MKIRVSVRGTVIIHYDIDAFNIDTPSEDIGSDKDALFKCLERGVALNAINPSHECHDSERLAYLLRTVPPELIQSGY